MREDRVVTPFTEEQAVALARRAYGLDGVARALPGEYDSNFQLKTPDGPGFVLKVMHPARERAFIDLQCQVLEHLAHRAPDLALPRVCRARDGSPIVSVADAESAERLVFVLTWVPGTPLAEARPHSPELLQSLGWLLGRMDAALLDFSHPAAYRELKWDLSRAGQARAGLPHIPDPGKRDLAERFLVRFDAEVVPALPSLRRSLVHGDANDHNVLVGDPRALPRQAVSVIDFGDAHHGLTVSDLAIAAAYALLGKGDPLAAAARVVAGYHQAFRLQETEIALLYSLIGARLAVSVCNSAYRKTQKPDDPYVTVSEAPAWEALARLAEIPPDLAHYGFRAACGLIPVPRTEQVVRWLKTCDPAPLLGLDLRSAPCLVFDLSVGSLLLGADRRSAETEVLTRTLFGAMKEAGVEVGVGRYDEVRLLYRSPLFGASGNPTDERRTIHLGIDLFTPPGSPLYAPLEGTVHRLARNQAPQDYGPLLILRHQTDQGVPFFTLYGHLSEETLAALQHGQRVERGERIGWIGAPPVNGDWPPHLHFQIVTDLLDLDADFPGVAHPSRRTVWTSLSPDPNVLLGIPAQRFPALEADKAATLAARRKALGPSLSLSYRQPLKMVRGFGQYLYDESGRAYLDVYNNVPLVGHSHPRVVRAAQEQLALLNTNTRYLHDNATRYAERLTARMPGPLRVCFFLNSGSEANELALRLARAHTRQQDVIVLEHAYHGHTSSLIDLSPYKFDGPGGGGRKPWVHVAPLPDTYRGRYRSDDPEAGVKYARQLGEVIDEMRSGGRGLAAFLAETLPSVAGQIVFPPGYLAEAYRYVHAAGGVSIADEVQTGFGRLGSHSWGFEMQGVVPDIVVLGKPIGNAFPLAAVVTTREIAASFDNGMEFFSTFGGNPVACAVGLAVLDVVEEERLQQRALRVGRHLTEQLGRLMDRYPLIGDVRGAGLFLGVELVRDRATREAAAAEADYVVNRLRECGVLTGTDGPHHNVLKLRPPLIFSEADADLFADTLARILDEDAAQV
ncbi:MAG TPA: aminotransferase class III-fold pyridoxal phosphate-dependent enzyme [Vicinamibacteria bacterium]|nr:aminotransferase class III-fold pyridoxal phosphate-dependent enzyme [Vicinamibacteria bacterium]